ncbi:arginine deiminase-related protein [Oleiagrimonas sp. MCCC 1A03011]|jgi:N-dimethylarginine dimethylaminohydrolase|uniref:dimethylarginine dimethylaminohydrolase family protein n=1 Tax=Oleiagrimonas sp. MCCC 1A03011 TaxID=1926883 RepID=UPI000DC27E65|nr:arginine deiminase-related protein [Oleiagrimonas sp. MCCC 1A03011]RAP58347.1 nitrate reductase [Oleiagrimonas sp. MCCC 1A03011]
MTQRPRMLMCPPTYFEVSYVINPWMARHVDGVHRSRAQAQWDALHALLSARAEVRLIEPAPGLPDMPFTANAGVVLGDTFVPSRFRHAQRKGEEPLFEHWFAQQGYTIQALPEGLDFEGAGDALLDRGQSLLWMGYGHRSDAACADILGTMLDIEVIPLRLSDARFYHLDTCFCPLQNGALLYHPAAFDDASRALIEERVPAHRRLAVGADDAAAFACNAVDVNDAVILNRASDALRDGLRGLGYDVIETPLGEFMKSGGSAKCLTLRLDEPR